MKLLQFLNIVLCYLTFVSNKLIGVVEVIRHGSRSPSMFSKIGKRYFFDAGARMLSVSGFRQHYIMGKFMRDRYIRKYHLLPNHYQENDLQLYTSATQRTIFSLTGQILGLYPGININPIYKEDKVLKFNGDPPLFNKKKFLQKKRTKVDISITNAIDNILHAWACKNPDTNTNLKGATQKSEIFSLSQHNLQYMLKVFGEKIPYLFEHHPKIKYMNQDKLIKSLIDYVRCTAYVSEDYIKTYPTSMVNLMKKHVINRWYGMRLNKENSEQVKASVHGLFSYIMNFFINKIKNEEEQPKLVIFSGHDTNIIDLLVNLLNHDYIRKLIHMSINDNDSFHFIIPKFASNLIFELHQVEGKYFVKIMYNAKKIKQHFILEEVEYNKREGLPFEDFKKLIHSRKPETIGKLIC
jgi:hypothetical protein